MDWSAAKAKEIFKEVYGAKIKRTPRSIGYDFEAVSETGKTYAIEAKGTDTDRPDGRIQIKWKQLEALILARDQGKVPILFIANQRGDFGAFVLQHSILNNDEHYEKGELP